MSEVSLMMGSSNLLVVQASVVKVRFPRVDASMPSLSVRLPMKKGHVHEVLWKDYTKGFQLSADRSRIVNNYSKKKMRADFGPQAERIAWRIIEDWCAVQLSMIDTKQAEFTEIFLPYIFDGSKTLFERVAEGGGVGKLLLAGPARRE